MLTLRLMGGVEVARDGEPVTLPRSKKTRALLAYLAMTGRAHRRDHLCAMFWDLPDDPRGALRWSLSRLRPLVNDPETARIVADRDTVRFDPAGVYVDVIAVRRRCAAGLAAIETSELRDFAQVLQGAFLEGLSLPRCDGFQSWCIAERDDARALHGEILRTLISRLSAEPCAALPYARSLVQVDPLDGAAHADLCLMLTRGGHRTQAKQQFATASRLLADAGITRSAVLEKVRCVVGGSACNRPVSPLPTPARNLPISEEPATHYAKSGGVHVAYQVFGDGPVDLVLTPGFVSHIENYWDEPGFARAGAHLARQYPNVPVPIYRFMFSDGFTFGFPPAVFALEAYLRLLERLDPGAPWLVGGLAVDIAPLIERTITKGGHLRVGLEDAPFGTEDSNLAIVERAVAKIEDFGGTMASAADIRAALEAVSSAA